MNASAFATCLFLIALAAPGLQGQEKTAFEPIDIFRLEFATDPQISPDGKRVAYVRNVMDVKKDRRRSTLWIINVDGSDHRALTSGDSSDRLPRWSHDSTRLLYLTADNELMCRWMDNGNVGRLAKLPAEPLGIAWSPDGKSIAFTMHVAQPPKPFVQLPVPPKGAEWADPPVMFRSLDYRFDGKGYLKEGHHHLFVLPSDGGTPRQLTKGPYEHVGTPAWTPDGDALLITGNRHPEGGHEPLNTEIYQVAVVDGSVIALTKRKGPDNHPIASHSRIAFTGFDDKHQGYQVTRLYIMDRDGSEPRLADEKLDRDVKFPVMAKNAGLFYQYDDEGNTKIATLAKPGVLADNVGGTTLDRPYASGSFSVSDDGALAFTQTSPLRPAEVAVRTPNDKAPRRLTQLSSTLFDQRDLATVEAT